jgi:predicted nucleic acid-binding protein
VTLVIDASTVVAALIGQGRDGEWAEAQLAAGPLAAPHLLAVEVSNVLRRAALAGHLSDDVAALAHTDLLQLQVELIPYAVVSGRVWELRPTITAYDACYVALAEELDVPLATLDLRLARAAGPRCRFLTP